MKRPEASVRNAAADISGIFGSGTEKLEEAVSDLFPEYSGGTALTLDTVKRKGELTRKLKAFRSGKTQILIGTQIIAKGLDFRNVGHCPGSYRLTCRSNIPDFQLAGAYIPADHAGGGTGGARRRVRDRVVIQTYSPEHYAVAFASQHDYKGFFETEKQLRAYMGYPPYSDLFQIRVYGKAGRMLQRMERKAGMSGSDGRMAREDQGNGISASAGVSGQRSRKSTGIPC